MKATKSHSEKNCQNHSQLPNNKAIEINKTPSILSAIAQQREGGQASSKQGMDHETGDKVSSASMEVKRERSFSNPTGFSSVPEKEVMEGNSLRNPSKSNSELMVKSGSRLSDSSKSGLVSVSPSSSSLSSEGSSESKPQKKKARKSNHLTSIEGEGERKASTTDQIQSPFLSVTNTVVSPTFPSLAIQHPQNQHLQVQMGRPRSNSVPHDCYSSNPSVLKLNISSRIVQPKAEPQKQVKRQNASSQSTGKSGHLRRGKWTAEEEAYVARVIQDFNSGYLKASAGTTLRTYLSDKLNCDPMRITKKFTGDACIGKRVFHPAVRCSSNAALIDKAQVRCSNCCHII